MRFVDADVLSKNIKSKGFCEGNTLEDCIADILEEVANLPTVKYAVYQGDTGFYDGCTKGYPYHYVECD